MDTDFLHWLEGVEEILPRSRQIRFRDLVAAFRAVFWLRQHIGQPKVISPHTQEDWESRYNLLLSFLWGLLQLSWVSYVAKKKKQARNDLFKDLEALERVLGNALPAESVKQYRSDIRQLRRHKLPPVLPGEWLKRKRTGGKLELEQTSRMRAAIEYLKSKGNSTPYADLANFWNERLDKDKYLPVEIQKRLAKGDERGQRTGIDARLTARLYSVPFWQRIYGGDFREVFPTAFPLHPKLASRITGQHPN